MQTARRGKFSDLIVKLHAVPTCREGSGADFQSVFKNGKLDSPREWVFPIDKNRNLCKIIP